MNQFVAGFFGIPRINLMAPATLGVAGDGLLGVRPEDLEISAEAAPGSVAATVALVELTGAETWVTLSVSGERVVGRAAADAADRYGAGELRTTNMQNLLIVNVPNRNAEALAGELGDVLWYVAQVATEAGMPMASSDSSFFGMTRSAAARLPSSSTACTTTWSSG